MTTYNYLDVAFPLRGKSIPVDHGYALFSALSQQLPAMHSAQGWAVHPVYGHYDGCGTLVLDGRSHLRVRVPASDIAELVALVGRRLDVHGHPCVLTPPHIVPLRPSAELTARVVVIRSDGKNRLPLSAFTTCLQRQLATLLGDSDASRSIRMTVGAERKIRVKNVPVYGYSVALHDLDDDTSLTIQIHGLGGRRHLGAGVFIPPRRPGRHRSRPMHGATGDIS